MPLDRYGVLAGVLHVHFRDRPDTRAFGFARECIQRGETGGVAPRPSRRSSSRSTADGCAQSFRLDPSGGLWAAALARASAGRGGGVRGGFGGLPPRGPGGGGGGVSGAAFAWTPGPPGA